MMKPWRLLNDNNNSGELPVRENSPNYRIAKYKNRLKETEESLAHTFFKNPNQLKNAFFANSLAFF